MLMSADTLLRKHAGKALTDEIIRDGMIGNLCRCTGYANIIRAIKVRRDRCRRSHLPITAATTTSEGRCLALKTTACSRNEHWKQLWK